VEIGIPLPAGKLGAGSQRRGEQSPAQVQCAVAKRGRSSVCFYIHTMGGYPTVRPGLAGVFTTELAVYA
jgi:hypothetical protein